jgi:hypothetical protein
LERGLPGGRATARGLLAAAALVAAALAAAAAAPVPRVERGPGVIRFRDRDRTLRVHLVFGTEALFAAGDAAETRDLAAERPEELAAMRARLLRRRRAGSIADLVLPDDLRRRRELEALGYLGPAADPGTPR